MAEKKNIKKKLTEREQQELDVSIGFLEGIVRRDPAYVEALQLLGDDYTRRGKFQSGLEVDEMLNKLRPEDPMVQYNLACSYSLTGQFAKAADALNRALDLGYRDFKWFSRDPDLKPFRAHALYKAILARVRKLKSQAD